MEILGIIPARAGSKRIPHKNTRLLKGKPLIAYTIEAAQESMVNRLILSSDDPVAIDIALSYGVEVPFTRPAELSTDNATTLDVVVHAVNNLNSGYEPDIVVVLEPTSPLRTASDIDELLRTHMETDADSVFNIEMGTFSMKREVLELGTLYGEMTLEYEWDGIDINEESDFELAEMLINDTPSYALY